jgi:curved DNA-binding protein CbpA
VNNKDLYKRLGLSRDASQDDIQNAHRKLVRKYHPDTNPEDIKAEERFKEIQQAYEVLSNPEKRREYDERFRSTSSKAPSDEPDARADERAGSRTTRISRTQARRNSGPLFWLGYLLGVVLIASAIALLIVLVLRLD